MTRQEIFDRTKAHLLTQGPAFDERLLECRYRTDNGKRCAIGYWISDELYDPKMEGHRIWALIEKFKVPKWFKNHPELLMDLQTVHDQSAVSTQRVSDPDEWRSRVRNGLRQVAINQDLEWNEQ